ncbi:MAG: hypothetical protein J6Y78_04520 [Paludibacteraceae bacterium]|nr:hypothetical protein [Paludibacteraceae bacterium]
MTNLLDEEIRAIRHTMAHLKKGISLEGDSGKRYRMEKSYKELEKILVTKLENCEDFKG